MASANDPLSKEKRRPKCSGCHILHEDHTFGTPGPACQGPPQSPEVKLNLDIDDESQPWEYENTKAYLANGAKPKDKALTTLVIITLFWAQKRKSDVKRLY